MKHFFFLFCFSFFFLQASAQQWSFKPSIVFNANTTVETDEYQSIEAGDTIQLGFDFESNRLIVTDFVSSDVIFIEEILGFEESIPGVQTTVWTNMSRWEIIYGFSNNRPMIVIEFPYLGMVEYRKYYWIRNKAPNPNGQGGTTTHSECTLCWWTR